MVEADGKQDGVDLAEILVDHEHGPTRYERATGRRDEFTVEIARVVEPRTVHVVLRSFHSAAVQLHSATPRRSVGLEIRTYLVYLIMKPYTARYCLSSRPIDYFLGSSFESPLHQWEKH